MISIYVAVRFEWQYGVGALIATGHDVFVTAGFYSVLGLDFNINTVAALLLLAGYSINDTVVVFDRIRENRRKYKRMPLVEMINLSTNQIATRTTLVSVATAMSVVPLLVGRPCAAEFQHRHPVRHPGRNLLLDLCRLDAAALHAGSRRQDGVQQGRRSYRLGRGLFAS